MPEEQREWGVSKEGGRIFNSGVTFCWSWHDLCLQYRGQLGNAIDPRDWSVGWARWWKNIGGGLVKKSTFVSIHWVLGAGVWRGGKSRLWGAWRMTKCREAEVQ